MNWSICQSVVDDVPPSQWEVDTRREHCFKRYDTPPFATNNNNARTAPGPGTALFQHWIRDYQNETSSSSASTAAFDPWNDFPTEDILKKYPDISDEPEFYTLWYTTNVSVPQDDDNQLRGHLTLHGVNYQPIVYFDGELISPYTIYSEENADNQDNTGGMFLRRHYDLGLSNNHTQSSWQLEILVRPPPFVGKPCVDVCTTDDCQGGDHTIAKSGAIMQCSVGWDWINPTPDRNVGIWDEVEIEWTAGDVKLHDVWVLTSDIVVDDDDGSGFHNNETTIPLPLGDDVRVSAWIDLTVTATRHDQSNNSKPIEGEISYWITTHSSSEQQLASGTIYNVTIDQRVRDFHLGKIQIPTAKLWWPHTHGSQPLYIAQVKFRSSNDDVHEACASTTFGIRTVSSETGAASKSFTLKINGHPIYLAGGNWITTDQFLRFSNSYQRYFDELTLLANAGFNSVRVWGGGITETQQFYRAADKVGMLVYQEFWMTGDNNGRFAGEYDWPTDHVSYTKNVRDVVRRLRNHPSLAFFGSGNELHPTEKSPSKDIQKQIERYMILFDGTRPYVKSSMTEVGDTFDPTEALCPKDGPYGILSEESFFDRNPGLTSPLLSLEEIARNVSIHDIKDKHAPGRNIGFQAEIGSVSYPEMESLKRFLSRDALQSFPRCGVTSCYEVNHEFAYWHWLPFTDVSGLDRICEFRYPPLNNLTANAQMSSVEDYTWAAQFVQYNQYHALVQGYSHRIFERHSGFYIWKTNSGAPTFRGSLYDWFLATNGGYWGARAGLSEGSPVRLVFNQRNWTLDLVNTLPKTFVGAVITWSAHSLNGTSVGGDTVQIPDRIQGNRVTHLDYTIPWIEQSEPPLVTSDLQRQHNILLYRLEFSYQDESGATIYETRNDYYLTDPSDEDQHHQSRFALLGAYRKVIPKVRLDVACTADDEMMDIECNIFHPQKETVAIMTRFSLLLDPSMDDGSDYRILPTFYSQNYITLLPRDSSSLLVKTAKDQKKTWWCLPDGYVGVGTSKRGGFFLVVSIDGWNVEQKTVLIRCNSGAIS